MYVHFPNSVFRPYNPWVCHEIFIEIIQEELIEIIQEEKFDYRHKRIKQNKDTCEICMLRMRLMPLIFAGGG